ncbi:MAG: tRNA dimethylallyltransferase, partial [Litorivivens sp.]
VDPKAAERINPNDPQRLQRALEVYLISGKSLSEWQSEPLPDCPVDLVELAIVPPDRRLLHQRIEARFRQMLEQGLIAEVEELYQRSDLHSGLPAIKSVGYRQAWAYLDGQIDFDTMVQKSIVATRQLAKRQYTWLRSWEDLRIIEAPLRSEALKILG